MGLGSLGAFISRSSANLIRLASLLLGDASDIGKFAGGVEVSAVLEGEADAISECLTGTLSLVAEHTKQSVCVFSTHSHIHNSRNRISLGDISKRSTSNIGNLVSVRLNLETTILRVRELPVGYLFVNAIDNGLTIKRHIEVVFGVTSQTTAGYLSNHPLLISVNIALVEFAFVIHADTTKCGTISGTTVFDRGNHLIGNYIAHCTVDILVTCQFLPLLFRSKSKFALFPCEILLVHRKQDVGVVFGLCLADTTLYKSILNSRTVLLLLRSRNRCRQFSYGLCLAIV